MFFFVMFCFSLVLVFFLNVLFFIGACFFFKCFVEMVTPSARQSLEVSKWLLSLSEGAQVRPAAARRARVRPRRRRRRLRHLPSAGAPRGEATLMYILPGL